MLTIPAAVLDALGGLQEGASCAPPNHCLGHRNGGTMHRSYQQGRKAGVEGARERNPYTEATSPEDWRRWRWGYADGREESGRALPAWARGPR